MKPTLLFTALLTASMSAHAVDGEILITQAKALAGNVTPGDAPGFPVTISQPGKYKLAGNLTVNDMGTTGIFITSPDVTLDLNGFVLRGPNTCSAGNYPYVDSCDSDAMSEFGRGNGVHIDLPDGSPATVSIENGTVRGFAGYGLHGYGVSAPRVYAARHLHVAHNGLIGIYLAALVNDSIVSYNGRQGIVLSNNVTQNTVIGNRLAGMVSTTRALNISYQNGSPDLNNDPLN